MARETDIANDRIAREEALAQRLPPPTWLTTGQHHAAPGAAPILPFLDGQRLKAYCKSGKYEHDRVSTHSEPPRMFPLGFLRANQKHQLASSGLLRGERRCTVLGRSEA
jgi:hypothetical protein